MTTDLLTPETTAAPEGDHLGAYAQRAYLEYALSVVKGRALPDVCDGQKPPQPSFGIVKVKRSHVAADWDAVQSLKP